MILTRKGDIFIKSRYDFFKTSSVLDIDGQPFPDPLLNHNDGTLSKIPSAHTITSRDLTRFWTFMWEHYSITEMDDVLLNINGIQYLMDLRPGDIIYKVVPEDLTGFLTSRE